MDNDALANVRLWLLKARNDLGSAKTLAEASRPYLDTAIYHCQQAAEKAIKGFLVYHGRMPDKTHDVRKLATAALELEPEFARFARGVACLTPFATAYRYPDLDTALEPTPAELEEALQHAQAIYEFILKHLPAQTHPEATGYG